MWYELELAASYERTGQLSLALKKFCAVEKHFQARIRETPRFRSRSLSLRATRPL